MNSHTSGPSANISKLLVSDTTNVLDQNMCFLKVVLVLKQKVSYSLDFSQIVYIYHETIEDKFPSKIKNVRIKVLIKSFRNRQQLIFSKSFTAM